MKSLWMIMIVTIVVILAIFFYASIFLPTYEAPRVAEDVEVTAPPAKPEDAPGEDVVLFAFTRTQPEELKQYLLAYKGMGDPAVLDENLKRQNYSEVLKQLWSEEDEEKKLRWLREKSSESHPILLFELAVEEIKADPSLEGFTESLYYLELGRYRTELDALCINDSSAAVAAGSLYNMYSRVVSEEVEEYPELVKEIKQAPHDKLSVQILEKVLSTLKDIRNNISSLPSPKWVSEHALKKLLSNKELILPSEVCRDKQIAFLDTLIEDIDAKITQLKSVTPDKS